MAIHSRSDIDPTARIADEVNIGPGVVVESGAIIEHGVEIGPNAVIGPNTILREGVRVFPGAIIGTEPQDMKYDGSPTRCEIGPRSVIREYATINRGTSSSGATLVGADSYIMSYAHIAHDCRIGDHVIMANNASLAGHCKIEDHAVLGGYAILHQYVRVGTLAMIGGFSGLRRDAPPYMITYGYPPARVYGLNSIGLKRSGMSPEARAQLKAAFRILYRSGLNFTQALDQIRSNLGPAPEIEHLLKFFETTTRGVCRGAYSGIDVHDLRDENDGPGRTDRFWTGITRHVRQR